MVWSRAHCRGPVDIGIRRGRRRGVTAAGRAGRSGNLGAVGGRGLRLSGCGEHPRHDRDRADRRRRPLQDGGLPTGLRSVRRPGQGADLYREAMVCFRIDGPVGYLALKIEQVYSIETDAHRINTKMRRLAGDQQEYPQPLQPDDESCEFSPLEPGCWNPVGSSLGSGTPRCSWRWIPTGERSLPATLPAPPWIRPWAGSAPAPSHVASRNCTATLVARQWVLTATHVLRQPPMCRWERQRRPPRSASVRRSPPQGRAPGAARRSGPRAGEAGCRDRQRPRHNNRHGGAGGQRRSRPRASAVAPRRRCRSRGAQHHVDRGASIDGAAMNLTASAPGLQGRWRWAAGNASNQLSAIVTAMARADASVPPDRRRSPPCGSTMSGPGSPARSQFVANYGLNVNGKCMDAGVPDGTSLQDLGIAQVPGTRHGRCTAMARSEPEVEPVRGQCLADNVPSNTAANGPRIDAGYCNFTCNQKWKVNSNGSIVNPRDRPVHGSPGQQHGERHADPAVGLNSQPQQIGRCGPPTAMCATRTRQVHRHPRGGHGGQHPVQM